jgi:lysophospholipase L1-like esterase
MLLLLLTLSLVAGTVSAQDKAGWDSTHRPGMYKLKVEQFGKYPDSRKDIIFLGNSITAGVDWHELLGLRYARNRGISGDITFGVLERLDEVVAGKPRKIFILIGINDIARNIPDSVIINNHKRIVAGIRAASPRTRIYLQTLMPVNSTIGATKQHYNKDEHIAAVNSGLKELAAAAKITLIDLHTPFLDENGRLKADYTYDGLHLNARGYEAWRKILLNNL